MESKGGRWNGRSDQERRSGFSALAWALALASAAFAVEVEAEACIAEVDIVGQVLVRREIAEAAGADVLNALTARSWIAMPVLFLQRSVIVKQAMDNGMNTP
jgi:hypothetical protein